MRQRQSLFSNQPDEADSFVPTSSARCLDARIIANPGRMNAGPCSLDVFFVCFQ
jgi:hypothetical protein